MLKMVLQKYPFVSEKCLLESASRLRWGSDAAASAITSVWRPEVHNLEWLLMGSDLENFSGSQLFSADLPADRPHIVQVWLSVPCFFHVARRSSVTERRAGDGARHFDYRTQKMLGTEFHKIREQTWCDRRNMNLSKNIQYYLEQVLMCLKYSEAATLLSTPVWMQLVRLKDRTVAT